MKQSDDLSFGPIAAR